jgi:quinol monooxygenase YgiN
MCLLDEITVANKMNRRRTKIMIVEYTRYKIDGSRREKFEHDYKQAARWLDESPHCLAYELTCCTEDPEHYVLRIEWDSEQGHLKGFRESAQFKAFFPLVQPYFHDIEEMRHYRLLPVQARKA